MHRRLWLSVAMLAAGASLLVAASLASAAGSGKAGTASSALKKGGTWRIASTGDIDAIDPQIAYGTTSWWMQYATAAKLFNYPDRPGAAGSRLRPEVASRVKIARNGKTYTFTIRKGFRFSDGKRVTANNFRYALLRALNKDLNSPAAAFLIDTSAVNIVGAKRVNEGKAKSAAGIRVKGNKLIIRLTRAEPTFMAIITMPFFAATSTRLPINKEVVNVSGNNLPSAGPYYVSLRDPNRTVQLKQNRFWKRGPGRIRPRNLAGVTYTAGVNEEAGFRQVLANQYDEGPLPVAEIANVARQFGVNRGRFWVKPRVCVFYYAMNTSRPLFRANLKLRQAVNFILRRGALAQQRGLYGGAPYTHILPPAMPGSPRANPYPLKKPNLTKARNLARGKTRGGKAVLFFFSNGTIGRNQMEVTRADLARIGLEVDPRGYNGFQLYDAAGKRDSSHDLTQGGWCQDYPDPYDFINILLYGGTIQPENNVNLAYFNNPKYNKKMLRAARKVGAARLKAYRLLDLDITKNAAPWASTTLATSRFIFSNRVDPRSLVFQGIYEDWSIPALALK